VVESVYSAVRTDSFFFKSNGRYIDYLSFTCVTSKGKNIKSYTINTKIKREEMLKTLTH